MRGGITRANIEKLKEKYLREINWEDAVELWMEIKKVFTEADKKKLESTIVTSEKFGQIPVDDWVEKIYNEIGSETENLRRNDKPLTEDIKQKRKQLMYVVREVIRYTTDKEEGEDEDEEEFIWNRREEGEEDEDEEEDDGIERIFNEREGDDEEEEDEDEDEDEEERVSFPPLPSRFGSGLRRKNFVDRTVYFPR